MKKPKAERGPKVSMPIKQPQTTITNGVRRPSATDGGGLRSMAVIGVSSHSWAQLVWSKGKQMTVAPLSLMQSHENPSMAIEKADAAKQRCKTDGHM
jgi:hypothetical protein